MPHRRHGLHFSEYMLAYVESRTLITSECIPIDAPNRDNHLLKTLALVGER